RVPALPQPRYFLEEPGLHHRIHAAVDPLVEHVARQLEHERHWTEHAAARLLPLPPAERSPGSQRDLHGPCSTLPATAAPLIPSTCRIERGRPVEELLRREALQHPLDRLAFGGRGIRLIEHGVCESA